MKFKAKNTLFPYFLIFTNSPCFSTTDEKSMGVQMKMCEVPFPRDLGPDYMSRAGPVSWAASVWAGPVVM